MLVIDDHEDTLGMVATMLHGAGFEVRTSIRVDEIAASFGDWQPDVILTDVTMPGTSGVELCRLLKATYDTAHVPIVLFSSLPNEELESLARICEADGFLSKNAVAQLPGELALLLDTMLL